MPIRVIATGTLASLTAPGNLPTPEIDREEVMLEITQALLSAGLDNITVLLEDPEHELAALASAPEFQTRVAAYKYAIETGGIVLDIWDGPGPWKVINAQG